MRLSKVRLPAGDDDAGHDQEKTFSSIHIFVQGRALPLLRRNIFDWSRELCMSRGINGPVLDLSVWRGASGPSVPP